jgi:NaMN:DMB phosphoribosyltransferase
MSLEALIRNIQPIDEKARAAARARQDSLTKPPQSLGRLEELSIQLAGITGAALGISLAEAACKILGEMATFDEAGVSGKA